MDQLLLQRTRYVLRNRVRRMQTCPKALFIPACYQFSLWIKNHPVLSGIVQHLRSISGFQHKKIIQILSDAANVEAREKKCYDPGFYEAKSVEEHAAICLSVVEGIATLKSEKVPPIMVSTPAKQSERFVFEKFGEYLTGNSQIRYDDALVALRDVAVDGLYEYLDEQLDSRNMLYAILQKYKQRTEWFRRCRLQEIADDGVEGKTGERALALDLQEYILDQGVEFIVEPVSASGEVDLILRDSDGRRIIIDAKYIAEDASRSVIRDKLAAGFNQVARYCNDYGEPSGFLVPFIRTSKKVAIELSETDGLQFLTLGGKTIFYVPVDIASTPSASKQGQAEEVRITADELVRAVSDLGE